MSTQRRNCQTENSPQKPDQAIFSLKCLSKSSKSKLRVRLDFGTISRAASKDSNDILERPQTKDPLKLLPQYSYNTKIEMQAFLSEDDQLQAQSENQALFQRLIHKTSFEETYNEQNILENNILMTPKPTSTYCQLCKEPFDDYLQHIEHTVHKKKLQQSWKSNKMISDLVSSFQHIGKQSRSQKLIRDKELDGQDQLSCSHKSTKVRVIENQNTLVPMRLTKSLKLNDAHTGTSTSSNNKIDNSNHFSILFK